MPDLVDLDHLPVFTYLPSKGSDYAVSDILLEEIELAPELVIVEPYIIAVEYSDIFFLSDRKAVVAVSGYADVLRMADVSRGGSARN